MGKSGVKARNLLSQCLQRTYWPLNREGIFSPIRQWGQTAVKWVGVSLMGRSASESGREDLEDVGTGAHARSQSSIIPVRREFFNCHPAPQVEATVTIVIKS